MFSSRTPDDMTPNALSRAIARKRDRGAALLDLTESNPTRARIPYPSDEILAALAAPEGIAYSPDPRGLAIAREAVARYYERRGVRVDPERLVLTASTSEAYALLFKLLADPGDEVLVPVPSYPLFEHLARIEGVTPTPYTLADDGVWRYDAHAVGEALSERTRAVVVVSPNNPTGSVLKQRELDALVAVCREREVALICDEVFSDYPSGAIPNAVSSVASEARALTFTLNGLSKIAGLPQLKVGWIAVNGPDRMASEAMERLEFAADLFLSVGTPVQYALAALLELAPDIQTAIRARVAENRRRLTQMVDASSPCGLVPSEAGWYGVLRVPRIVPEEELTVRLVEEFDTVVQPGFFFDFPKDGYLVVSLLAPPDVFAEGAARAIGLVERICRAL